MRKLALLGVAAADERDPEIIGNGRGRLTLHLLRLASR